MIISRSRAGLYYYRARYYHPGLARFISEDPLGFAGQDANLYAYVFNDPINLRDPLGLDPAGVKDNCRYSAMGCHVPLGGRKDKIPQKDTMVQFALALWHFDRARNGERLIHYGKYRFNRLGQLVEHTGKVVGEATGKALEALKYLRRVKPDFFARGMMPLIIWNPCAFDATLCGMIVADIEG